MMTKMYKVHMLRRRNWGLEYVGVQDRALSYALCMEIHHKEITYLRFVFTWTQNFTYIHPQFFEACRPHTSLIVWIIIKINHFFFSLYSICLHDKTLLESIFNFMRKLKCISLPMNTYGYYPKMNIFSPQQSTLSIYNTYEISLKSTPQLKTEYILHKCTYFVQNLIINLLSQGPTTPHSLTKFHWNPLLSFGVILFTKKKKLITQSLSNLVGRSNNNNINNNNNMKKKKNDNNIKKGKVDAKQGYKIIKTECKDE